MTVGLADFVVPVEVAVVPVAVELPEPEPLLEDMPDELDEDELAPDEADEDDPEDEVDDEPLLELLPDVDEVDEDDDEPAFLVLDLLLVLLLALASAL